MKKTCFVIAVPAATAEQQNRVTNHFKKEGFGFWHWFPNLWLLSTFAPGVTASQLRDEMNRLLPGVHNTVLQVKNEQWAFFGPARWGEWFRQNWQ